MLFFIELFKFILIFSLLSLCVASEEILLSFLFICFFIIILYFNNINFFYFIKNFYLKHVYLSLLYCFNNVKFLFVCLVFIK